MLYVLLTKTYITWDHFSLHKHISRSQITSQLQSTHRIDTMVLPPIALALYAFATCLALTEANEDPVGTLYAYGTNISGLPLFYGDGKYSGQPRLHTLPDQC